jgi:signal transduction histidine kinase
VRAATTRFYQNLGEDFIPGAGLYQVSTGRYFFSGEEGSRLLGAVGSLPYLGFAFKRVGFAAKAYRLGRSVALVDSYAWATMSYEQRIATVIRKYGFNLRGRRVVYDARLGTGQLGMTSSLNPEVLRIGAGVMNSEQELAATIAHELRHSRAFMGSGSNSEAAAEAVEQALREYIQGLR